MAGLTTMRARQVPAAVALVLLATASCANILGIEDPAGHLDGGGGSDATTSSGAGSPVTSSGGAPGAGGAGAGGGSTSSSGTTGSTSSSGGGGGLLAVGAVELPDGFTIDALGTAPSGVVMVAKRDPGSDGSLCAREVGADGLAVVAATAASCDVVGRVDNPPESVDFADEMQGLSVERRGDWLGLTGTGREGPLTLRTGSSVSGALPVDGAGFLAVWNVMAPEDGYLLTTAATTAAAAVFPLGGGGAHVVLESPMSGFDSSVIEGCSPSPAASSPVHFTRTLPGDNGCSELRPSLEGHLLDVHRALQTWALLRVDGSCVAIPADEAGSDAPLGGCSGRANLLADAQGESDLLFAGITESEECSGRAGIMEGAGADPTVIWCDPADAQLERVVPFHVGDSHLHFLRADDASASLLVVPRTGGEAEVSLPLCTMCQVADAVAVDGAVYVIGHVRGDADGPIELFGESIAPGRAFWAWTALDEL